MVELEALGRVHPHHLDAGGGRLRLLLAQAGLGDGGDRAGEVTGRGLRRAAGVGGGQLAELGEVDQPLGDLGRRREQQLAAQAEALDQPVREQVRARGVELAGEAAVELEEGEDALPRLRRDLRGLHRRAERADHVELAAARDLRHAREVDGAQLDGRAGERAHDRAGVPGVDQQPQPGEQVAHLGALEERRGAGDAVGDGALLQRDGDRLALALTERTRTATVLGAHAVAGDQPLDVGGDGLRLGALVRGGPEGDLAAGIPAPARFSMRSSSGRDDGRGGGQDRGRHPVGALQPHDSRPRTRAGSWWRRRGSGRSPGRRRRPRLTVRPEHPQQQALGEVDVLQVVDQHVRGSGSPGARARAGARAGRGRRAARDRRGRASPPPPASGRGRRRSRRTRARARPSPTPRSRRRDELVLQAVDAPDHGAEHRARVAAQVVVGERQLVDALEQHRQPVALGDGHRERVDAGLRRLVAQQLRAEAVERGDGQRLVRPVDGGLDAGAQRLGRGGREGQDEDVLGGRPVAHQSREALDQRASSSPSRRRRGSSSGPPVWYGHRHIGSGYVRGPGLAGCVPPRDAERDRGPARRGRADRTARDGHPRGGRRRDAGHRRGRRGGDLRRARRAARGGRALHRRQRGARRGRLRRATFPRVVIDPIDGSTNAKRGLPHHSVSIAVADGPTMADVVFGYVYDFGPRGGVDRAPRRGRLARRRARSTRDRPEQRASDGRLELLGLESSDPRLMREAIDELADAAHRLRALGHDRRDAVPGGGARGWTRWSRCAARARSTPPRAS